MNPENQTAAVNQPPETPPPPGRSAEPEEARVKKPGIFRAWLGLWRDRDLDLEGRDTSDWNIYYYYFRQVYQHTAPVKLKYMRWIALLFQIYFFGMILLAQLRSLLVFSKESVRLGKRLELSDALFDTISMLGVSANIYIMPVLLFIPVFMVGFKLRAKAQGFITSRAKEPPLLAHLVQYTSNKGLVQGALQSLLFTWGRFILLLLPAIIVAVLLLTGYAAIEQSDKAFKLAFGMPVGTIMAVLTLSLFFMMQPFCYRLDTLMLIIGIGIETIVFTALGFDDKASMEFWTGLWCCYVPSTLFACAYFPLAAADTGEYGLGKRTSKWIRILLYSVAGAFLVTLLATNAIPACHDGSPTFREFYGGNISLAEYDKSILFRHREFVEVLFIFFKWGLFLSVSGLLVTSVSVISYRAAALRLRREDGPLLRKLFDPASPVSLVPVVILEIIALMTVSIWTEPFSRYMHFRETFMRLNSPQTARVVWTAIHFGIVIAYIRQLRRPEMKEPWNSHVRFNMVSLIGIVAVELVLVLSGDAHDAKPVSFGLYVVSIVVMFAVFGITNFRSMMKKPAPPEAAPSAEQNEEAS